MPFFASPLNSGLSGVLLGLTAGLAPGPMLTLVLSHTLRYRIREGCRVALAPLLTDPPIILVAVFLSIQARDMKPLLAALSLLGTVYLIYLGYETLHINAQVLQAPQSRPQSLLKGMITNFLNPHPYLFWLTVGAPILSAQGPYPRLGAGLFLLGFYTCLIGAKMVLAWVVGSSRFLIQGRTYTWSMRFLGMVLWGFALSLAFQAGNLFGIWEGLSVHC